MITPEFAVYMWMIPCLIFFIFPFLCLPFFLMTNRSSALQPSAKENRKQLRKEVGGIFAQVLSENKSYNVAVNNISKDGFCFSCSPGDFDQHTESYDILLTESDKKISIPIKPEWVQKQGEKLNVGGSIINTQEIWGELAGNMEKAERLRTA